MRILSLTGALALALAAASPAALSAQDTMASMTAEQHTTYMGWSADQRAAFDAWPADLRTYYWTLTPTQQTGWWRLTDEQRAQIFAMTPEARAAAWSSIEAQMAGMPPRATPATPNPGEGMAATPATPSPRATVVDNTLPPPPASAMNKDYPVCTSKIQDSCQNPGEGGAPGRSRALKYWPGKPASEGGK